MKDFNDSISCAFVIVFACLFVCLLLAAFNKLYRLFPRAFNPLVFGLAVASEFSDYLTVVIGDIHGARACLLQLNYWSE